MEQVKGKANNLFYFILGLIVLRPSLDILSQWQFQLHASLPDVNINQLIGLLVFGVAILYLMSKAKSVLTTPLFWPIMIFMGLLFMSIFYSINSAISGQEFIRLATIFLLYSMSFQLVKGHQDFLLILKAILLSYILPAIFALGQFILGSGLPDDFGGFNRIYGTFAHPNPFAFYTMMVLSLVLVLVLSRGFIEQSQKKILWAMAGLMAFLLLATYSRSALFALMLFLLFFGIFKYRKLLIAGLAVFIVGYFFFPSFQQRIWELISLDPYGSVVWRLRLWKDMWPVIFWQPLFGQGLGTFTIITEFYRGFVFGSLEAHNDYLKIVMENGLLGLAAYLSILTLLLVRLCQVFIKTAEKYKGLALGILIIVLSLAGVSFFDNILRATALQWNLWILLGAWFKLKKLQLI